MYGSECVAWYAADKFLRKKVYKRQIRGLFQDGIVRRTEDGARDSWRTRPFSRKDQRRIGETRVYILHHR